MTTDDTEFPNTYNYIYTVRYVNRNVTIKAIPINNLDVEPECHYYWLNDKEEWLLIPVKTYKDSLYQIARRKGKIAIPDIDEAILKSDYSHLSFDVSVVHSRHKVQDIEIELRNQAIRINGYGNHKLSMMEDHSGEIYIADIPEDILEDMVSVDTDTPEDW